ncbi:Transmembrane protein 65 [Trichoplax sp. H2]|nr:Transmembrane protein 65 [Trichoplax sp. H2]|eukprot:RDD47856.1 Transmembrane protein 65 [Trichoplax sp. H2]
MNKVFGKHRILNPIWKTALLPCQSLQKDPLRRIYYHHRDSKVKVDQNQPFHRPYSSGFVVNRYRQFRGDDNFLTENEATAFIMQLHSREREILLRSLLPVVGRKPEERAIARQHYIKPTVPSLRKLLLVAANSGIPFIAFGFLDNVIMITAGEYIEFKVGAVLTISTMAAAGLGNMVSDVAGLCFVGYIEGLTSKMQLTMAQLSAEEKKLWQTVLFTNLGRTVGVLIGCLLGLSPLLFYSHQKDHDTVTESSLAIDD